MSFSDPIGDLLTRIRNAQMRGKQTVRAPHSKLRAAVLDALAREGFINGSKEVAENESGFKELEVTLRYHGGAPAIRSIGRVSRPGRRVYAGVGGIPEIRSGLGVSILSTSQGVLSDAEAIKANVGGEVLCKVF